MKVGYVPEGDILINEMNGSLLEAVIHFQPSNYCLVPNIDTHTRSRHTGKAVRHLSVSAVYVVKPISTNSGLITKRQFG